MTISLSQIAQVLSDLLIGFVFNRKSYSLEQLNVINLPAIEKLATLQSARSDELAFLANPRYLSQLEITQAGAVLVDEKNAIHCPDNTLAIVVKNPYLAYARLTELFRYISQSSVTIHPTAIVPDSVKLGDNVQIGAYCVLGENVEIGNYTRLDSHVTLEDNAIIGKNCQLKSHVFIGHHCQLGDFVTLHSHAGIGNEGFGFAPCGLPDTAGWQKIHQLGRVIIGNHVRIGSHTCVDRGAIEDTIIGDNVIIDNLVQIAHNVEIGAGTAIAACTGIAGSAKVGKRCVLAGGVGLVGHITLADDVTITGMSMVTKSITQAGSYSSGTPLMQSQQWKKSAIHFKQAGKEILNNLQG